MIVEDNVKYTLRSFQSLLWDNEKKLDELINDASKILIEFKSNELVSNIYYLNSILIQEEQNENHYTNLIFHNEYLIYDSDLYVSQENLNKLKDRRYINVTVNEFILFIRGYLKLIAANNKMYHTLNMLNISQIQNNQKIELPDSVEISFKFSD